MGFNFYKLGLLVILSLLWSCDAEDGLNCTQTAGDPVIEIRELESFDRILVEERVRLVMVDGPDQQVEVITGQNLLNDVSCTVQEGQLVIVNNNGCNVVRDYGLVTIRVTSPEINEIRSSTGITIESDGVLSYDRLHLISDDGPEEDFYHSNGDFDLQLDLRELRITTSNLSNFYLTGSVQDAFLEWQKGDGRLIAENLEIQRTQIFHRGTNVWNIDVKQKIAGTIAGYGDVRLISRPGTVQVDETWRGRLIIAD